MGKTFEGSSFYALDEIQYIYFPKPPNPILSTVYDKTGTPRRDHLSEFSFSNVGAEFSGAVRVLSSSSSSITISSPSSIIDITGRLESLSIGLDLLFPFQEHTKTIKYTRRVGVGRRNRVLVDDI